MSLCDERRSCPKPKGKGRDENRLWICPDCDQAWVLRRIGAYGEDWLEWREWPAVSKETRDE